MIGKGDWMQRLTEGLDLPGESMPGLPLVEIAGERRLLVENHGGICQYGPEQICIRVKYGIVGVQGRSLEISRMTKDQLIISGRIECVTLNRRGKP